MLWFQQWSLSRERDVEVSLKRTPKCQLFHERYVAKVGGRLSEFIWVMTSYVLFIFIFIIIIIIISAGWYAGVHKSEGDSGMAWRTLCQISLTRTPGRQLNLTNLNSLDYHMHGNHVG